MARVSQSSQSGKGTGAGGRFPPPNLMGFSQLGRLQRSPAGRLRGPQLDPQLRFSQRPLLGRGVIAWRLSSGDRRPWELWSQVRTLWVVRSRPSTLLRVLQCGPRGVLYGVQSLGRLLCDPAPQSTRGPSFPRASVSLYPDAFNPRTPWGAECRSQGA